MSMTILDVSFSHLKDCVAQLDRQVYTMAVDELYLTSIDPVLYLYAIVKLGPSNASAKWMIEHGLSEHIVLNYIEKNLPKRPLRRRNFFEWLLRRERQYVEVHQLTWSQSLIAMVSYLRSLDGYQKGSRLYVYDVFVAVIDSFSEHVEPLFASVGVSMEFVRVELKLDEPDFADVR